MTTQEASTGTAVARPLVNIGEGESVSERLVAFTSKAPVHFALILISVIWLVPTVGLLVTSFRERSDILTSGWWESFTQARFTLENYQRVLLPTGASDSLGQNFVNSIIITVPSTILPLVVASLAAYAFAWLRFRWRDWIFMLIVALLVVPLQMTFVPVLQLYNDPLGPIRGLFGLVGVEADFLPKLQISATYLGLWLAHTAYG
ncbi:MAG: hypothetical protein LC737_02345, partial [Chloroflexi bacterium]|nr:hypothetical protein [Chloroflexota bacterium]